MKTLSTLFILLIFVANAYSQETIVDGITKEIIKEGKGESPKKGQQVKIEFEGYLPSGEMFENTIFKFNVGDKELISGWNIALPTMKVGEKAKFTFAPQYAYGEKGAQEDDGEIIIPPNSNVIFIISLISVK